MYSYITTIICLIFFLHILCIFVNNVNKICKKSKTIAVLNGKYILSDQKHFTFIEGLIFYLFYHVQILGKNNIITKFIQYKVTEYFNSYRIKCPVENIIKFAKKNNIKLSGWDKKINKYKSIDEFFSRNYKDHYSNYNNIKDAGIYSPVEGTIMIFKDISYTKNLWVKCKQFSLSNVGIEKKYLHELEGGGCLIFKLDVFNLHRIFSPVNGKIESITSHIKELEYSHSIRPVALKGGWQIFSKNRRVIITINTDALGKIVLVIVGGIAIDSIEINVNLGQDINPGDQLGCFHMGGSAVLMFVNKNIDLRPDIICSSLAECEFKINLGDTLITH